MFLNLFWCNSQAKNYVNLSRGGGGEGTEVFMEVFIFEGWERNKEKNFNSKKYKLTKSLRISSI